MRFLFIGSRFMLHASFPHSVALMQLRFTSFVVINSRRDLHPQVCAHAGRTKKKSQASLAFSCDSIQLIAHFARVPVGRRPMNQG